MPKRLRNKAFPGVEVKLWLSDFLLFVLGDNISTVIILKG